MSLIILDRDGVINKDSPDYIKSPDEWGPLPGSLEAIARLNRFGYRVVVATNQSGIARGLFNLDTLNSIHHKMHEALEKVGGKIDKIFFCPHRPEEKCYCRKPNPGLLMQIAAEYQINLLETYFIGDAYSDVQAALNAKAKPLFLLSGRGKSMLDQHQELANVKQFQDLSQAVSFVLSA